MNLNIVQLKVVEVESTNSNYMDSEKTIDKNRRKFSSLEKGIYNFIIIFYLFRKKYLIGFNLISVGLGLEILINHLQITYYGAILIGLFFVFQL